MEKEGRANYKFTTFSYSKEQPLKKVKPYLLPNKGWDFNTKK